MVGAVGEHVERSAAVRLAFLICCCAGACGVYFGYNVVGATAPFLHQSPFLLGESNIGGLMAAYSVPNWVMPLFGGRITDTVGVRWAAITFSTLVMVGALLFFVALCLSNVSSFVRFGLMELAMVVFGLGAESLTVALKAMLASWFLEATQFPQMAFAVALVLTFGYGGSVACRWATPTLAEHSVNWAFALSAGVSAFSALGTIIASIIHKQYEEKDAAAGVVPASAVPAPAAGDQTFSAIVSFPKAFYLLVLMLATASGLYASYEIFWCDILVGQWLYSPEQAGVISSIAALAGMVLVPACGALYDAVGRRVLGATCGCLILCGSWLSLTLVDPQNITNPALVPVLAAIPQAATAGVALGGALLFGGLWPCVPLLIPQSQTGLAFGFMTAMQNIALSFTLVTGGLVHDASGRFAVMGTTLALLGMAAALMGACVIAFDPFEDKAGGPSKEKAGKQVGGGTYGSVEEAARKPAAAAAPAAPPAPSREAEAARAGPAPEETRAASPGTK